MPAALILLLAWTLFAFGAVYDWGLYPAVFAALLGAITTRITRPVRAPLSGLDVALLCVAGVALLQLVPLPGVILEVVDPGRAAHLARTSLLPAAEVGWAPLTLVPRVWLFGAGLCVATIATFFWARDVFDARAVRRVTRAVAWMGLAVSVVALIQPALFPNHLIYGIWKPWAHGADPVGPIISRNHFAAWVVLAWPLTVGYLISHGRTHWQGRRTSAAVLVLSDTRALWLVLSAAMMIGALLITRSRGGAAAFALAAAVLIMQSWRRIGGLGRAALLMLLVVIGAAVSLWATPDALLQRFEGAYSGASGGRPQIWTQTMQLVRAFPVTGIGLGTFDVVMPAYQTDYSTLLNHAHNQYLHLLAEGGVLMAVPLTVAALQLLVIARRRLRAERGPLGHIRAGAWAGLVGLAAMSVFETPLLTPAVAFLAAVSAAIVTRSSDSEPTTPEDGA